jgi:hypothetical protein
MKSTLCINYGSIIYYEHVKGYYQHGFYGEFLPFGDIIFQKKPLFWFWYFQQPSHLSLSLTQQIYCDTLVPW